MLSQRALILVMLALATCSGVVQGQSGRTHFIADHKYSQN